RVHGGGDRGPERTAWADPGYWAEGPRHHHQGGRPAGGDAEILLGLELLDGGTRDLFHGFLDVRGGAARAGGADSRGTEAGQSGGARTLSGARRGCGLFLSGA